MGVYMRAVISSWPGHEFGELVAFVGEQSDGFVVSGDGWADFEIHDPAGDAVLIADLITGEAEVREELEELLESLDDLRGSPAAHEKVEAHLRTASAVVGMQIIMSRYDESVAAANQLIAFLERSPGVLTQIDTVGWYDLDDLILQEPE
ncbi:type I secretion C-terminal target domain-containing protein [Kribbella sp. NBC_01505]|uniref:type I secretion C-terminal target domain-containing protein n=1 Tax=Kribbella sp. NBC_01505 TaxID=2903580 RepID=UPI00386BE5C7